MRGCLSHSPSALPAGIVVSSARSAGHVARVGRAPHVPAHAWSALACLALLSTACGGRDARGFDAGGSACGTLVCGPREQCVARRSAPGSCTPSSDGVGCPPGTLLCYSTSFSGPGCVAGTSATQCLPLPAACGGRATCGCASSLCEPCGCLSEQHETCTPAPDGGPCAPDASTCSTSAFVGPGCVTPAPSVLVCFCVT